MALTGKEELVLDKIQVVREEVDLRVYDVVRMPIAGGGFWDIAIEVDPKTEAADPEAIEAAKGKMLASVETPYTVDDEGVATSKTLLEIKQATPVDKEALDIAIADKIVSLKAIAAKPIEGKIEGVK